MKRNIIETILGAIVLGTAGFFIIYGILVSTTTTTNETYKIHALFNSAGGIQKGSDIRLSGIVIGKVEDVSLDNENYKAKLTLAIKNEVKIPTDTIVEIASDGFLGGKYVRLNIGIEKQTSQNNDTLKNSKDVETIESMLGKLIFLTTQ